MARRRYSNEVNRLFGVLNKRLADRPFVAGDYSIADMAIWPWSSASRISDRSSKTFRPREVVRGRSRQAPRGGEGKAVGAELRSDFRHQHRGAAQGAVWSDGFGRPLKRFRGTIR